MGLANNVSHNSACATAGVVQPEPVSRFSHEPFEGRQFQFDRTIALIFDDMAARSIPGYFTTQQLCINLCKGFAANGTRIYDIGSATGTTIAMLLSQLQHFAGDIFGIEPSEAMRKLCEDKLNNLNLRGLDVPKQGNNIHVTLESVNIEDVTLVNASAILCNYTLHFVSPKLRQPIIDAFYEALIPGGFLVLSEKTSSGSVEEETRLRRDYHRFKELNGYSMDEILDKENALFGLLTPLTIQENMQLLTNAGFRKSEIAFCAPPFVTFVAWK
jgi:tRNA (cmo5U34)-methyltransferase